jgi:hypothetical protein
MKRIVLAAVTCLSLLVAIPAVSAAYSSGHHAGRDHRPDDRGPHRNRPGDRHRDRERRDRLEHAGADRAGTAGAVRSFQNGLLTVTRPDGSTVSGAVTAATRVSCERTDRGHDDRHDENNNPSCLVMLRQPGTTIRHAELRPSRGGAVWEEIELGLQ